MKKIVTILGARPQFVKAAVLSRIIREHGEIEEVIVHTGQHYDHGMSAVFFEEMSIPEPAINLNVNNLGHGAMTGEMLMKIEAVLLSEKPDAVVVYGDTNSTLAGALAAKKLHIKLAHVEAGLRSFNMKMPEEINRIVTDKIADLLLCPTETAVKNLHNEGLDKGGSIIDLSGDIMKDAVSYYSKKAKKQSRIVKNLGLKVDDFVLTTIHRQENTTRREVLEDILEGLNKVAENQQVVFPLHPGTAAKIKSFDLNYGLNFIDPVGYFDMLQLLDHCSLVITDSGGLQKEAFFHEKPCIIARHETEWVELVNGGYAKLVGTDPQQMIAAYHHFRQGGLTYDHTLYGTHVGERIYQQIANLL
jgi:UDP-GlcNAc3NAcA epimerase